MKILLLGFVRIAHMPYMHDYSSMLKHDHELHLVSWNRNGKVDIPPPDGVAKSFIFRELIEDENPLYSKLPHIYRYRRFVIELTKRERYDKIVVLHSTPGIAIFNFLQKHYKGNYLLDYRDVSHENHVFYRELIRKLSLGAGIVVASSSDFFKYLDNPNKVLLKHNLLLETSKTIPRRCENPILVRYWGMIRHEQANIALIDELGGDKRFELHYNGREERVAENLKVHVSKKRYGNVFFHGAYQPAERLEFAANTNIIHNIYKNDFITKGAMGNKYYDGIQFHIPQMCTAESIMGNKTVSKGLGIAIDYTKSGFKEQIANYMANINYAGFDISCKKELEYIQSDNAIANKAIARFFQGIK